MSNERQWSMKEKETYAKATVKINGEKEANNGTKGKASRRSERIVCLKSAFRKNYANQLTQICLLPCLQNVAIKARKERRGRRHDQTTWHAFLKKSEHSSGFAWPCLISNPHLARVSSSSREILAVNPLPRVPCAPSARVMRTRSSIRGRDFWKFWKF